MNKDQPDVLPNQLEGQVISFLDDLEEYNASSPSKRNERDFLFLKDFYLKFIKDRNTRSHIVGSVEYSHVLKLALSQFPVQTFWNLCMDGRVLAVLASGASAWIGSSTRVPGGILREFVRGRDGKFMLLDQSNFATLLKSAFVKNDIITQVFDSHIGCAARNEEEERAGRAPTDFGLYQDVLHKKEIAEATLRFVKKNVEAHNKQIIAIQTSFDPHSGYLYMGLETDKALSFAKSRASNNNPEYTKEIINKLVEEGSVIGTEYLSSEILELTQVFKRHYFPIDWKNDYLTSAKTFWMNLKDMKSVLLPILESKVVKVYPNLQSEKEILAKERAERAFLLLANAYHAFLQNHNKKYPYGIHREEGIKVSEGGHPPYDISMFVVFSLDETNLSRNIELASSLVRSNREAKRIADRSACYKNTQEFKEAPVPVVMQEIIRLHVSEQDWNKILEISWKDLPLEWDQMSEEEFLAYLSSKGITSLPVAIGISNLRRRMALLFNPHDPICSHIVDQLKVILPMIIDGTRRVRCIIPFVKLGMSHS